MSIQQQKRSRKAQQGRQLLTSVVQPQLHWEDRPVLALMQSSQADLGGQQTERVVLKQQRLEEPEQHDRPTWDSAADAVYRTEWSP